MGQWYPCHRVPVRNEKTVTHAWQTISDFYNWLLLLLLLLFVFYFSTWVTSLLRISILPTSLWLQAWILQGQTQLLNIFFFKTQRGRANGGSPLWCGGRRPGEISLCASPLLCNELKREESGKERPGSAELGLIWKPTGVVLQGWTAILWEQLWDHGEFGVWRSSVCCSVWSEAQWFWSSLFTETLVYCANS